MSSGSSSPQSIGGEGDGLRRCIRDLAALNALVASCVGRTLDEAFDLVLEALPTALDCDLVLVDLPDPHRRRAAVWYGARVGESRLAEVETALSAAKASNAPLAFGS